MKLTSKSLVGAVFGIGGLCALGLTSAAGARDAGNAYGNPQTVGQLAQVQLQPSPSNNMVARMSLRITALENEIRRLTGENEELMYRLGELEEALKKATDDLALRMSALERGGSPAKPSEGAPMASAGANAAMSPSAKTAAPPAPVDGADKGAKVLGTLRSSSDGGNVAQVVRPPPVASSETPEQQYDRAHTLIVKHRKYGEAERVLRNFIDNNPKHALASNAHYWLGRTYFVRADYENAAFAFAEGFQKFPEAEKAPANLLNLGMSLARLGKNREACTTYTRLLRTYKDAEDSIKRRITRERQRAKCRER